MKKQHITMILSYGALVAVIFLSGSAPADEINPDKALIEETIKADSPVVSTDNSIHVKK